MPSARHHFDIGEPSGERRHVALAGAVESPRHDGTVAQKQRCVILARRHLGVGEPGRQRRHVALVIAVVAPGHDRAVAAARQGVIPARHHLHERLMVPGAVEDLPAPPLDVRLGSSQVRRCHQRAGRKRARHEQRPTDAKTMAQRRLDRRRNHPARPPPDQGLPRTHAHPVLHDGSPRLVRAQRLGFDGGLLIASSPASARQAFARLPPSPEPVHGSAPAGREHGSAAGSPATPC